MLSKVQIDRFALMNVAFDQSPYKVNKKLEVI